MASARIPPAEGRSAVVQVQRGPGSSEAGASKPYLATAARYLLQILATNHPGHTIEVRVPPFGAVQIGEGLTHRRGTPPNVVEMDAETWVALATGELGWADALVDRRVAASGTRADLGSYLPLREW